MADSPASCWDYRCEETETRPLARSVLYTVNKSDRSLTEGTDDSCTTHSQIGDVPSTYQANPQRRHNDLFLLSRYSEFFRCVISLSLNN